MYNSLVFRNKQEDNECITEFQNNMPSSLSSSTFSRRKKVILSITILAILIASWLVYSRFMISTGKTAAEQVAEEVAKSENPFKASNPLATVETNPFEKAKKVLNPFEQ